MWGYESKTTCAGVRECQQSLTDAASLSRSARHTAQHHERRARTGQGAQRIHSPAQSTTGPPPDPNPAHPHIAPRRSQQIKAAPCRTAQHPRVSEHGARTCRSILSEDYSRRSLPACEHAHAGVGTSCTTEYACGREAYEPSGHILTHYHRVH